MLLLICEKKNQLVQLNRVSIFFCIWRTMVVASFVTPVWRGSCSSVRWMLWTKSALRGTKTSSAGSIVLRWPPPPLFEGLKKLICRVVQGTDMRLDNTWCALARAFRGSSSPGLGVALPSDLVASFSYADSKYLVAPSFPSLALAFADDAGGEYADRARSSGRRWGGPSR